uniref:thermonuclease family protein n=1 Tax=Endozoicomonas sp. ONNA1 TaxID=2828740 RepID=UPI002147E37C
IAIMVGIYSLQDNEIKDKASGFLSSWSSPDKGIMSKAFAGNSSYGGIVVNRVNSVYDGDTIRVDIDGWPEIVGKNISIRVNGVDTPEIKGECILEKKAAIRARDFVYEKLSTAQRVELREIKRGKYFRLIAYVYIDGKDLSEMLINAGLARVYNGGSRRGWCK